MYVSVLYSVKAQPHYQHTQACKLQLSILHNIGPLCHRVSHPLLPLVFLLIQIVWHFWWHFGTRKS